MTRKEKIEQLKFENAVLENRIQYCVDFSNYIVKNHAKIDIVKFCGHLISVFRPPIGEFPTPRKFHCMIPPVEP